MGRGFSLVEASISLTLSLFILLFTSMLVDSVSKGSFKGKEEMDGLQELYSGMDRIGYEMKRCGMGLDGLGARGELKVFELSEICISIKKGNRQSILKENCYMGEKVIWVKEPELFKEGREILITDFLNNELNKINKIENGEFWLEKELENNYYKGSKVIQIDSVSFKFDKSKKVLRLSQNSGPFQPLIERVDDLIFEENGKLINIKIEYRRKLFNFKFFLPCGGEN